MRERTARLGPLFLAAIATLLNAAKPVVVDDAAYLTFARHIASHPLDPYGFTAFWYTVPEPAMDILAPPVLLYWLAFGIRLFGEHVLLLKLWLFPFLVLLAKLLDVLLRRFAPGTERFALPLIVLSPAVLPTVNLMLDVPAAALGLAALARFVTARSVKQGLMAGLLAGLAMQTKYTALLVPVAILGYGALHGRVRLAILAGCTAAAVFAGWEALLALKYGESHFLHHVADQQAATENWWSEKTALIPGLVGNLGCLGFAVGLYAARSAGVPSRVLLGAAILWCIGVAFAVVIPGEAVRVRTVWRTAGTGVLLAALAAALPLLVRRSGRLRHHADSWFVVGWVLLELAGYFALTPFPAARRVIGLTLALGVFAGHAASRMQRLGTPRTPPRWLLPFGIALGVLVAALDLYDARAEKELAEQAAAEVRGEPRVWFAGHWGFQFYCERAGFTPFVPGQSVVQPGDLLVLPLLPGYNRLYRPHVGRFPLEPPASRAELLRVLEWDDALPAATIPSLYGGSEPIEARRHPRLRVGIYRVRQPWSVPVTAP